MAEWDVVTTKPVADEWSVVSTKPAASATTKEKITASVPVRFAAGVADPALGINALYDKIVGNTGQFITSGAGYFPNPVSDWLGQAANSGQTINNQETSALQSARLANGAEPGSTDWARLAGNVASPVNYAMAPAKGAGVAGNMFSGAAIGGSQPVDTRQGENYNTSVLKNTAVGGLVGGILGSIGSNPSTPNKMRRAAQVKLLQEKGIEPSIGQQVGGTTAAMEERLGSIPVLGHFTHAATVTRPTEDLNNALYSSALKDIGDSLPAGIPIGRPALSYVNKAVGKVYDDTLGKMSLPANSVDGEAVKILSAYKTMPQAQKDQFLGAASGLHDIADNGIVNGKDLKGFTSDLRKDAMGYSSSANYPDRQLGQALFDLHSAVTDAATAANPLQAPDLAAADAAYTKLIRINKAAAKVGATDGVITPSQFNSAVLGSVGKRAAAKASGALPMQDLADAANTVLSPKVRNSGTPERTLLAALLAGAATNPVGTLKAAALIPPVAAAYSRTGQKVLGKVLTGPTLADMLRKYAPTMAPTIIKAASKSDPYLTRAATYSLNQ